MHRFALRRQLQGHVQGSRRYSPRWRAADVLWLVVFSCLGLAYWTAIGALLQSPSIEHQQPLPRGVQRQQQRRQQQEQVGVHVVAPPLPPPQQQQQGEQPQQGQVKRMEQQQKQVQRQRKQQQRPQQRQGELELKQQPQLRQLGGALPPVAELAPSAAQPHLPATAAPHRQAPPLGPETVLLIICANRPEYLQATLDAVAAHFPAPLSGPRSSPPIVISQDGTNPGVTRIIAAFAEAMAARTTVTHVRHVPLPARGKAVATLQGYRRLCAHYRFALGQVFGTEEAVRPVEVPRRGSGALATVLMSREREQAEVARLPRAPPGAVAGGGGAGSGAEAAAAPAAPAAGKAREVPPAAAAAAGEGGVEAEAAAAAPAAAAVEAVTAVSPRRVIILEEDLLIAPDFFEYFAAAAPLLERDASLLAVSAWNDDGMEGFVKDPTALRRTDFFPGLGWMLQHDAWLDLEPSWPDTYWDDWLRGPQIRRGREFIYPEVSRTFHFGTTGTSRGMYSAQLQAIQLSDRPIPFRSMDLSYLDPAAYATALSHRLSAARAVTLQQALRLPLAAASPRPSGWRPDTNPNFNMSNFNVEVEVGDAVRVEYAGEKGFSAAAKALGLMSDVRGGAARTGYQGVVTFWRGDVLVHLAPRGFAVKQPAQGQ